MKEGQQIFFKWRKEMDEEHEEERDCSVLFSLLLSHVVTLHVDLLLFSVWIPIITCVSIITIDCSSVGYSMGQLCVF